jgi:transcriptional regulator with XRE-family HTH domain
MGHAGTIMDKRLSMSNKIVKNLSIGGRVRQERKRIGLTQAELAAQLGIHTRTQANYELGKTHPGMDYFDALQKIGIDGAYVLTGTPRGLSEAIQDLRAAAYLKLLSKIAVLLGLSGENLNYALDQAYKITLGAMLMEGEELALNNEKIDAEMVKLAAKLLHDAGIQDIT